MLYLFIWILLALLSITDILDMPKGFKKAGLWAFCLLFILLGSLRWTTGTDWSSYYKFFNTNTTFEQFILSPTFETGFGILNYCIRVFTPKFSYLLTVMALVSIGFKLKFMSNYTEAVFLTLLCYLSFHLGDMFAVRQTMALGISLFATTYIFQKRLYPFLLVMFIASTLHSSAYLFIPAYWLAGWRPSATKILIVVAFAAILGYLSVAAPIVNFATKIFGETKIGSKLTFYFFAEADVSGGSVSESSASLVGLAKRMIVIPILLLIPKQLNDTDRERFLSFLSLFVFGNILYFLFNQELRVMQRGAAYYLQYEMILLPYLAFAFKKQFWLVWAFFVLYCGSKLYYSLLVYWDLYIPYISIFDGIDRVTY